MRRAYAAALAVFVYSVSAPGARACTCSAPSMRARFRSSDAVFVGKVLELTPFPLSKDFPMAQSLVRFGVERRWKGAGGREVTAVADFDAPGMCGDLKLVAGERYLIYAPRAKGRLRVYTDCGPNLDLKWPEAAEEMKRLDSLGFRLKAWLYPFPKF